MLAKLRKDQPPFSTLEIIIVFIAADIPRFIGQSVAATSAYRIGHLLESASS